MKVLGVRRRRHYVTREPADFIVKVQIPVASSPGIETPVLVYNQSRLVYQMFPYNTKLRAALKGELKSFWYARYRPDPDQPGKNMLSLERKAPWQDW